MLKALLKRELGSLLETRDAAPRPTTFDPRALTIEAVIASSAPVKRADARGAFVEILDPAGLDIGASRGASVLDSHQQNGLDNVLGTLDDIRIEGNQVIGVIRFSSRPEIAPIIADVRSGVISHLSVGYAVDAWRDAEGNGIRSRTATKWVIHEASFVSVPADRNARTRSATPPEGTDRAGINRSIRELCHRAGVEQSVIDGLIDTGASIETARGVVLEQLVTRGRTSIMAVMTDANNREGFIAAAGEALYARANPSARISPAARPFVGLSIADLARETLHRNGISTTMMNASTLIERALGGGLHSTSDFPALLGDALGRSLREAYRLAPSGLRQLAREASAADFRLRHRIMLDSTGMTLELVPEGGEYKSGTLAEGDATYKLQTFGRIIGFTRQAMVNDDLGALTDMPRRLGSAAASFEAGFLTTLLTSNGGLGPTMPDGLTLFHANHGNFDATGGPPNEQTLSDARLAMRKQTGLQAD